MTVRLPAVDLAAKLLLGGLLCFALADRDLARFSDKAFTARAIVYDSISWWDDANHFVNWALLAGGVALLLRRTRARAPERLGLAVGFGAVTAILWELGEYASFVHANENELRTAYTDTLGDLALGLLGSVAAALAVAVWERRRGAAPDRP